MKANCTVKFDRVPGDSLPHSNKGEFADNVGNRTQPRKWTATFRNLKTGEAHRSSVHRTQVACVRELKQLGLL